MASYVVAVVLRDVPDEDATEVYTIAGLIVLAILIVQEYYVAVRPAKKIEELAPIALDGMVESLLAQLRSQGVNVRINLLILERTWRSLGYYRYFRMKWHKGMENQPDVNITFREDFGVSGQCVRRKEPIFAGPEPVREYALPGEAGAVTRDLQAVLSFPVYEPASRGGIQSGKVIGVLNLDSKAPKAYDLLTNPEIIDQLRQVMQTTADVAARFFG